MAAPAPASIPHTITPSPQNAKQQSHSQPQHPPTQPFAAKAANARPMASAQDFVLFDTPSSFSGSPQQQINDAAAAVAALWPTQPPAQAAATAAALLTPPTTAAAPSLLPIAHQPMSTSVPLGNNGWNNLPLGLSSSSLPNSGVSNLNGPSAMAGPSSLPAASNGAFPALAGVYPRGNPASLAASTPMSKRFGATSKSMQGALASSDDKGRRASVGRKRMHDEVSTPSTPAISEYTVPSNVAAVGRPRGASQSSVQSRSAPNDARDRTTSRSLVGSPVGPASIADMSPRLPPSGGFGPPIESLTLGPSPATSSTTPESNPEVGGQNRQRSGSGNQFSSNEETSFTNLFPSLFADDEGSRSGSPSKPDATKAALPTRNGFPSAADAFSTGDLLGIGRTATTTATNEAAALEEGALDQSIPPPSAPTLEQAMRARQQVASDLAHVDSRALRGPLLAIQRSAVGHAPRPPGGASSGESSVVAMAGAPDSSDVGTADASLQSVLFPMQAVVGSSEAPRQASTAMAGRRRSGSWDAGLMPPTHQPSSDGRSAWQGRRTLTHMNAHDSHSTSGQRKHDGELVGSSLGASKAGTRETGSVAARGRTKGGRKGGTGPATSSSSSPPSSTSPAVPPPRPPMASRGSGLTVSPKEAFLDFDDVLSERGRSGEGEVKGHGGAPPVYPSLFNDLSQSAAGALGQGNGAVHLGPAATASAAHEATPSLTRSSADSTESVAQPPTPQQHQQRVDGAHIDDAKCGHHQAARRSRMPPSRDASFESGLSIFDASEGAAGSAEEDEEADNSEQARMRMVADGRSNGATSARTDARASPKDAKSHDVRASAKTGGASAQGAKGGTSAARRSGPGFSAISSSSESEDDGAASRSLNSASTKTRGTSGAAMRRMGEEDDDGEEEEEEGYDDAENGVNGTAASLPPVEPPFGRTASGALTFNGVELPWAVPPPGFAAAIRARPNAVGGFGYMPGSAESGLGVDNASTSTPGGVTWSTPAPVPPPPPTQVANPLLDPVSRASAEALRTATFPPGWAVASHGWPAAPKSGVVAGDSSMPGQPLNTSAPETDEDEGWETGEDEEEDDADDDEASGSSDARRRGGKTNGPPARQVAARGRGRPRKDRSATDSSSAAAAAAASQKRRKQVGGTGARRGRPPKVASAPAGRDAAAPARAASTTPSSQSASPKTDNSSTAVLPTTTFLGDMKAAEVAAAGAGIDGAALSSSPTSAAEANAAMAARFAGAQPHPTQLGMTICDYVSPLNGEACATEFHRPYDLARHRETIHARDEASLVRQGKLRRDECRVLYVEVDPSSSLATAEWRCDGRNGCGSVFSRKDALLRHRRIRGHHK